ncbi:MAG: phosphoribosylamine--glycine ligase, partial [Nannocystaceae bacterium]
AAAKAFMSRYGIPTARYQTVAHVSDGLLAVRQFARPPVVKASGLASGKGVTVPDTFEQAEEAVRACLGDGRFGAAGETVVLEERLWGQEVSLFAITDGRRCATMLAAQDHKRLLDGDRGPNTGGMGAYCPAPVYTDAVHERVMREVVKPTLHGLRAEARPFVGALFVGLMIDERGAPSVIEYNCRFGDPETQPLLFGLEAPLVPLLHAAAHGRLDDARLTGQASAVVVLAAEGYPNAPQTGAVISGLEAVAELPDVKVFHAGTRREDGRWRTRGGRVLGVCARGDDLRGALTRAYHACDLVTFPGRQLRRDIGVRALT